MHYYAQSVETTQNKLLLLFLLLLLLPLLLPFVLPTAAA
jgi:hypothetical protein